LYATVKPRIDDSYKELIGVDANFDRTLERAIVMLLRTPVVDGEIQVRTDKVTYAFANPSLEELTKAQRQFLRMGPRNIRIVKAKLRAIAGFLGIPGHRAAAARVELERTRLNSIATYKIRPRHRRVARLP
jgi:DNA polymerase III epsilon subunit-like protein